MSRQTYSVEQIIIKLGQIEAQCGQGKTVAEAARQGGSQSRRTTAGASSTGA